MSMRIRIMKAGFKLAQHGPAIALGVGVASGIGAIIFAVRAGRKMDEIIDAANEDIAHFNAEMDAHDPKEDDYEEAITELRKEKSKSKRRFALKMLALYGPVVACEALSCACLVGGHITMQKRLTGALAAYSGLLATYTDLCEKAKRELGEEKAKALIDGYESETLVDADTGEETTIKIPMDTPNPFVFDWNYKTAPLVCTGGYADCRINDQLIHDYEALINSEVQRYGYRFMNQALKMIGLKTPEGKDLQTSAGAVLGWTYNDEKPVSFGIEYIRLFDDDGYPYDNWRLHFNCDDDVICFKIDDIVASHNPKRLEVLN